MPRPRTPTNVLKLKGSFKKDPQRLKQRENEPKSTKTIGEPSAWLSDDEKAAYNDLVRVSIDGVLCASDQYAVEDAATLLDKMRKRELTQTERTQLQRYFSQFGMLPADRSKISVPKKKETNPFDE